LRGCSGNGMNHACVGVRRSDLGDLDRDGSGCVLLYGCHVEAPVRL